MLLTHDAHQTHSHTQEERGMRYEPVLMVIRDPVTRMTRRLLVDAIVRSSFHGHSSLFCLASMARRVILTFPLSRSSIRKECVCVSV